MIEKHNINIEVYVYDMFSISICTTFYVDFHSIIEAVDDNIAEVAHKPPALRRHGAVQHEDTSVTLDAA